MPLANAPNPWHPCYLSLRGFFNGSQQRGNGVSAGIFHNQSAESCIIEISRCSLETVVRNPSLKSHKEEIFLPFELCMCSTCIQQVFTCACFSNTSFILTSSLYLRTLNEHLADQDMKVFNKITLKLHSPYLMYVMQALGIHLLLYLFNVQFVMQSELTCLCMPGDKYSVGIKSKPRMLTLQSSSQL